MDEQTPADTFAHQQPSAQNALTNGCKCGAPTHASDVQRCTAGHTLPGAFLAVQHALRTDRLPPEFAALVEDVETFANAAIADDGGATEISHRRQSLHSYRARVHRRIAQLDAAIEIRGLFDKRGKLRVAWLQQLQALINTAKGIDSLLGLERRTKRVETLASYLEQTNGK